ncbi:glutamine-hydrolyzing carbamoyl-phosphate synthase small subunit [Cellulophaga lytica]|uniref:Carbamoyl phosphate synthase small chain n=1 Tax=Cellulophaga lytica (strain ATCC 23178 / DSM 7489 / JCM 8516 / NBRC 14961 / NCIMB 1423 / VKM B-1433 / Cy l20) TaxID=867900 RepID=F0RF20_CELLC|nr:glutamine-hydrolyzing carbamoyl-phosphate synthase small subunit [Cellulophaga lytica]ADY29995.1 carbamoyl-phosphate synthase, small subunit [Cellulophaga lytica DSM 7489]AIM60989.1 carbamoyl phosphate synthase small subunit [Cellulophaga lytica]APU10855.1 carbamoyl phosphate synthase small subunit [Cellulophaga lytica]MDO6853479.1 glutamine-hydrolyzing carbamoyl-phosphate synthase small subunit [Cellulophaga lytica]WQG75841.1 glutamine-hydrolyzing carbamoyl-phosphate synthase small subunit
MKYQARKKALILLADGTIFHGKAVGDAEGTAFGEVCFNTGMTGYQEIFTDPSYFGQIMVTTNAHIGNYGTNEEEVESNSVKISGLVCKNFSYDYSRVDANASLQEFLNNSNLFAISDVDTRALVSYIRDNGAMNAVISTDVDNIESLKEQLANVPSMEGLELSSKVSTKEPYFYGDENAKYKIAALDIGIKKNILRNLAKRDAYIKVYPYNASYKELSSFNPDGYFISNGPGDPEPLTDAIQTAKDIIANNNPLFGICLGHQVIALANGVSTYKMHNGHRGINHPVMNITTGKGEITSQNHGFAINREETEANAELEITHKHLNDNTVAGIKMKNKNVFSVQYHPEASPGPNDSNYLFDNFFELIKNSQN